MPITSFSSPSAIAKPGVIANAAARPASPYSGQVVYQTDTGQAYVWNGSAWVLLSTGTANPPGLELISTTAIGSAVSSVVISSVFSSSYSNYRVLYQINSQSADGYVRIQFNNQTGSWYYDGGVETTWTSTTVTGLGGGPGTTSRIGRYTSALTRVQGSLDIMAPNVANRTWATGQSSNPGYAWSSAVQEASDTSHTGFTLSPSAGNWTGGYVKVYGYRD